MARSVVAALVFGSLAACSFQHGSLTTGDSGAGGDDAPGDSRSGDTPLDACASFSTHLDTCAPMVTPGGGLVLSGANSYNTDTLILTTSNGGTSIANQIVTTTDGEIVALLVSSFTLSNGASLRITGANFHRAFGIVSYGHVQIDGLIDLTDHGAGWRDDQTCSDLGLKGHKGVDDNGGGSGGGGGGGGSGGMIVLESAMVSIMGKIAANGGGGGEGADGSDGVDGTTGLLSTSRAAGGAGGAGEGGDAAAGGAGTNAAGQDATQLKNGGGGGGGGGVGFIAIGPATPVVNNATISPQFAVWP